MSTSSTKPPKLTREEKMTRMMLEVSHVEGAKAEIQALSQGLNSRLKHLDKRLKELTTAINDALKDAAKGGPKLVLPHGFNNRGPVG